MRWVGQADQGGIGVPLLYATQVSSAGGTTERAPVFDVVALRAAHERGAGLAVGQSITGAAEGCGGARGDGGLGAAGMPGEASVKHVLNALTVVRRISA